ncbi:MAG: leucine-rich repeat domain-containing protein [Bacteroidota bacterium]
MKLFKIYLSFLFVVGFSITMVVAQNEVSQREVIALLELKAKTKGHLWTQKWDQTQAISTWHGVTVKNGKVVGLDLSNNNLQGKIPITIGNLRHLQVLDLSGNRIEGKIPGLFQKFENLKVVNLANNDLAGNIPSSIHKLQHLEELNLNNNRLEGELPKGISALSKLKTLALANNDLQGPMPGGMENLKKLKKLYLANNEFSDLNALRKLSKQQLVMSDFKIREGNLVSMDFTKTPESEGLSRLEFEDKD